MPDLSENITFNPEDLQFWKKIKGRKDKKVPHPKLQALCKKWVNFSVDWCIDNNKWPVRFIVDGEEYCMDEPFIHCFWFSYVNCMKGRPPLTSLAALKVC